MRREEHDDGGRSRMQDASDGTWRSSTLGSTAAEAVVKGTGSLDTYLGINTKLYSVGIGYRF